MGGEILSMFRSEFAPRKAEFHLMDGKCPKYSTCGGQHYEKHDSFRFGIENRVRAAKILGTLFVGMLKTLKNTGPNVEGISLYYFVLQIKREKASHQAKEIVGT